MLHCRTHAFNLKIPDLKKQIDPSRGSYTYKCTHCGMTRKYWEPT